MTVTRTTLLSSCFALVLLAGGLRVATGGAGNAEDAPAAVRVWSAPVLRWMPEHPVEGTLFTVVVEPQAGEVWQGEPRGRFAGEPLHFQPRGDGAWWAPAAVPVDPAGPLALEIEVTWPDGRSDTAARDVVADPGSYPMERLTVAPEFGRPLPPELARRTEDESARAMAVARGAHDTPRLWQPGAFVRPRPGRVTSGFGGGREFNGQVQSRHMGTDLEGAVGDPVAAAADGVVALVDRFYLGGNVVYIDHGGGLSTGYLHLSEQHVAAGDTVRAGERIGSVGATGRVTGPHLHWILRYGGITVDALTALELTAP